MMFFRASVAARRSAFAVESLNQSPSFVFKAGILLTLCDFISRSCVFLRHCLDPRGSWEIFSLLLFTHLWNSSRMPSLQDLATWGSSVVPAACCLALTSLKTRSLSHGWELFFCSVEATGMQSLACDKIVRVRSSAPESASNVCNGDQSWSSRAARSRFQSASCIFQRSLGCLFDLDRYWPLNNHRY